MAINEKLKVGLILGGLLTTLFVVGYIGSAVMDYTAAQKRKDEAERNAATMARIRQRVIDTQPEKIAAALALKDTDPAAGLKILEPYKQIAPAAIADATAALNEALLKKRLANAELAMKREDFDAATDELLAYGFTEVPPAVSALRSKISDQAAAFRHLDQQRVLAQRKKSGVEIGMTAERVLQSSWGRPEHVNRTTTARGTHEQWVYGRNYLYFDNGILTAVQN